MQLYSQLAAQQSSTAVKVLLNHQYKVTVKQTSTSSSCFVKFLSCICSSLIIGSAVLVKFTTGAFCTVFARLANYQHTRQHPLQTHSSTMAAASSTRSSTSTAATFRSFV